MYLVLSKFVNFLLLLSNRGILLIIINVCNEFFYRLLQMKCEIISLLLSVLEIQGKKNVLVVTMNRKPLVILTQGECPV